jgi:hypothetical protein
MNILRVGVTALAVLTGTWVWQPAPVRAQGAGSPEALAAARDLFSLMSKDMVVQMSRQLSAQMWPLIETELSGKADAETLAKLRGEFERIQIDNLLIVMKDAPAIYARHFTAAELRELIAFNRSATGQKALHEMPQVMSETIALIVPRMQDLQKQTKDGFDKILRERGYLK